MSIIDISPPIGTNTPVWPGDVAFRRDVSMSIANGQNLDLSAITTTVHIGAHADAPSHYHADGVAIDAVDLGAYVGPCHLITTRTDGLVTIAHLAALPPRVERVLLRTESFPPGGPFRENFAAICPAALRELAARGCRLVGIDTPSVDPYSSKTLDAHQVLMETGMRNLEGLDLRAAPDGVYELIALPLRIVGADASPVRAALRKL